MNPTIILIIGIIIGFAIAWIIKKPKPELTQKESRKQKIIQLIKQNKEIANNDVEEMLGVSDATATNYLQELEDEGKIEQIGDKGRFVRYRLR